MTILGFILYLIIAAACAWIADYFVPGVLPGGFLTSAIFGLLGAWLGTSLMGSVGPVVAGVPIVSAIVGSAIVIFLAYLIGRATHRAL